MSFNAAHRDQLTVPGATNLNSSSGTIMFWMHSAGLADPATNSAILFDRLSGTGGHGNGLTIAQTSTGTYDVEAGNGAASFVGPGISTANLSDNNWHQLTITYDQSSAGSISIYVDGLLAALGANIKAWSWQAGQQIEMALSHDAAGYQPYNGLLDDVRVYNRILSDAEVASAFTGAIVDASALVLRLNFDAAPATGVTLRWLCPDAILESADTVTGPYTDLAPAVSGYNAITKGARKFYRYHDHSATPLVSNPYLM